MDWNDIDKLVKKAQAKVYDTKEESQATADNINNMSPPWSCPLAKDNCAGNGLSGVDRLPVKRCVCFAPARVGEYGYKFKVYGYCCTAYQLFGPEGL